MKALSAALPLLAGCSGQAADVGADAALTVRGGTFVREALPPTSAGPAVEAAFLGQTAFPAAHQNKSFTGSLASSATALSITLAGDIGYWIVPAGAPNVETPELPSFDAPLSFSRAARSGPHELWLSAVDAQGRFGPRKVVPFTLTSLPLEQLPLVFSLYWDRPSDLDLHVVLPNGVEIYKDEMSSWEPTLGVAPAPGELAAAGRLDLDSNPQCRIDGRNNENVLWQAEPPHGTYTVRVETFSLCGESAARFQLEARYWGEQVALVQGESLPTDTRGPHGGGAGTTLLELEVR